ncbi:hypothetical protein RDSD_001361 [Oleidesulfovibrio alaskensis]
MRGYLHRYLYRCGAGLCCGARTPAPRLHRKDNDIRHLMPRRTSAESRLAADSSLPHCRRRLFPAPRSSAAAFCRAELSPSGPFCSPSTAHTKRPPACGRPVTYINAAPELLSWKAIAAKQPAEPPPMPVRCRRVCSGVPQRHGNPARRKHLRRSGPIPNGIPQG